MSQPHLPSGHPPWETFNGARIGAAIGLLVATIVGVTTSLPLLPALVGGGLVGALAGYLVVVRTLR